MNSLTIETETQLEELLSEPTAEVIETLGRLPGDILFLGVAGKMGPTLARMARRASDASGMSRRIIGVSRFSAPGSQEGLAAHGVETIPCDLLNEAELDKLPDAPHVFYLAGKKFGSTGDEATTWLMNAYLPALVAKRYRSSRIVAFSSGNIYGLVPVSSDGSREEDPPRPVGEYAMSCLARERIFEAFSRSQQTAMALIRLNYACELRYGVVVDLAQKVQSGEPIDLGMGYLNTIWQGDANALALRALEHTATPPTVINLTGPERLSVRTVAERLSQLMNRSVRFLGTEADSALLNDARHGLERLGTLQISADTLIERVAAWVSRGGTSLGKPTHFESRDGVF
ncbi:NAD-dependent epimerase/dehydratase family protein [Singulisphaera acidiphila]|uniref:Nucleoside-diphosphate-sugar epimerase n=1 Tax=Singulisphaera acidiphila (strain ATCC BAA-1392 / DSM 18658 / VKM B-2454 / MOB10) TaxID=886293 RepID=L0D8X1_SINAD|nr:NAD-dependent epimerase/dehydratase family protein [Singulisphaera acidiphila]AGA25086.1 nucleoside-diphosphate-sugar epimerase [Singulisphaera acidiphila DSM 18658]